MSTSPGTIHNRRPARRAPVLNEVWAGTRPFRPVLILLVLLIVVLSLTQREFATTTNIEDMLTANSTLWVIAIGMTFVLLSGGFDLSVGATSALVGVVMAKVIAAGIPAGFALVIAIISGGAIGAILNGVLIGSFGLSVFVVTLASMTLLSGVVVLWAGTTSFFVSGSLVEAIGDDRLIGIPVQIWIMIAILALGLYLQARTYFGRDVYALGGNATAARLSGIRTPRTLIIVYALVGVCAGIGGALALCRIGSASAVVDTSLPLEAIAAVLLGGTALTGGYGGVIGTALGVLFIGILQNGLSIAGVPSAWQNIVTGIILVIAVAGSRRTGGGSVMTVLKGQRSRGSDQGELREPPTKVA